MTTKTTRELFQEACKAVYVPVLVEKIIDMAFDYCFDNNLDCGIESGENYAFKFWVMPNHQQWFIDSEDDYLIEAVITGVAQAYNTLYHEKLSVQKVIDLAEYRKIKSG